MHNQTGVYAMGKAAVAAPAGIDFGKLVKDVAKVAKTADAALKKAHAVEGTVNAIIPANSKAGKVVHKAEDVLARIESLEDMFRTLWAAVHGSNSVPLPGEADAHRELIAAQG